MHKLEKYVSTAISLKAYQKAIASEKEINEYIEKYNKKLKHFIL